MADRLAASSDPDFEDDIDTEDVDNDVDAADFVDASDASDEPSPMALVAAGLLGAAIGAGLGLLVSRAAVEEPRGFAAQARRRVTRAGRDVGRRAERVERRVRTSGAEVVDDTREALAEAVRALGRTREELTDRIERELRQLRKAARRGRKRGWLR